METSAARRKRAQFREAGVASALSTASLMTECCVPQRTVTRLSKTTETVFDGPVDEGGEEEAREVEGGAEEGRGRELRTGRRRRRGSALRDGERRGGRSEKVGRKAGAGIGDEAWTRTRGEGFGSWRVTEGHGRRRGREM